VQDTAYGTLLRQPRRALHARIADTLEKQFPDIAEGQPDLLARHCTEAGLIDKAAGLWGKAGLRSLKRSALVEAIEQLRRALGQIATLPGTPALRGEEIRFQVALLNPLMQVKGAPETKTAAERALLLIEQAEALGEPPKDPLLPFRALYGLWLTNVTAFNGDLAREGAAQILAIAEKQRDRDKGMLMLGHRCVAYVFGLTGNFVEARVHYDQAIAPLDDPVEHRPLVTRFAHELRFRSLILWFLGYPEAGLAYTDQALKEARETGPGPASLMAAMDIACFNQLFSGNYATAKALSDEQIALAEEKGAIFWKTQGLLKRANLLALTGNASGAVSMFTSLIPVYRSMGITVSLPWYLSLLARACGELGQFEEAWSYIREAITAVETTKERWYEAEAHRIAGEIALMLPEPDAAKAEACFERALAVARAQQAKSFELRAAMSMARLWRDQGKRDEARELLAPVYGWFTEGFDTPDLKQAKALLDELA
jgi:predicted ATPase